MPQTSRPGQIPLDFGHEPAATREDLIVSDRLSAVIGLIDRFRNGGTHGVAIKRGGRGEIGHDDSYMIETSEHAWLFS